MNSHHPTASFESLLDRSTEKASKCIKRDAILHRRIKSLEDVPEKYKVSKESGLDDLRMAMNKRCLTSM